MKKVLILALFTFSCSLGLQAQENTPKYSVTLVYCAHENTDGPDWTAGLSPETDTTYSCNPGPEYMVVKTELDIALNQDGLYHYLSNFFDQEILNLAINEDYGTEHLKYFSFTTADGVERTGALSRWPVKLEKK